MERRALAWLAEHGIVDRAEAEGEIAARPDPSPSELGGPFDPFAIAAEVARDLRELYGDRLRRVILFGSWARGDAHPESDIDLLVVLDRVESAFEELKRMNEIMWQRSGEHDTVVSAIPMSEAEVRSQGTPFLRRVAAEGREVA
jgi:hypothetical protein